MSRQAQGTHETPKASYRLLVVLVAVFFLASPAFAARGGPDGFGYTWRDTDEPGTAYTPPSYVPNNLRAAPYNFVGDDVVTTITLPQPVTFYGVNYTTLYLSSNGWLSFVNPASSYPTPPAGVPNGAVPNGFVAFMWGDYTLEGASSAASAGVRTAGDGYTIAIILHSKADPNTYAAVFITVFWTGFIEVYYPSGFGDPLNLIGPQTLMGIESGNGMFGLPYMTNGVAAGGANFRGEYAVKYEPRGNLNCTTGVTPVSCPLPATASNNSTGTNNVTNWNCAIGTYMAPEKVFQLNLARMSHLDITLTNTDGRNRHAFLVRSSCSEISGCLVGGATLLQPRYVTPGTYYIVVDGVLATDVGNFTLAINCTDSSTTTSCGTTLLNHSTAGPDGISNWSCLPAMTGPDRLYEITVTGGPVTVASTLANESDPNLWTMIIDGANFNPNQPSCLVGGTTTATAFNIADGTYYIGVDGALGVAGSYDLNIECIRRLQCPSPTTVISLSPPVPVAGDTTGKPNNVENYQCEVTQAGSPGPVTGYSGGEDVYQFTLATAGLVSFSFNASNPDMRLLILRDCYEGSCVVEGGCGESLAAGTYRLVVDGINGATGTYTITPNSFPFAPYTRWHNCPECTGGCNSDPTTVRNRRWSFNSMNYCGTGCDFSLFAVVECGTEFHTPFSDVETGHMKVYDIFNQRFLNLTAMNDGTGACAYTSIGTTVQWEDNGCLRIPCPGGGAGCGGGSDCRTNGRIMDVSFTGTPNVCGVYRLDFNNWGGWAWDAFANCTGTSMEQFYIYRDLCSAIDAYKPRPEIGIGRVLVDNLQCASMVASGTIELENIGCAASGPFEIVIDAPAASNPQTVIVNMAAGATGSYPWTYNFSTFPADLVFTVDGNNVTLECSESLGTAVSCGTIPLLREVSATACPQQCFTTAIAGPPEAICEGSPLVLDGSASTLVCVTGNPEYRWLVGGTPVPGCDWGALPTCNVPPASLPPGLNIFVLETQCANDVPTCVSSSNKLVDVAENVTPDRIGNELRGIRDGSSVNWSWGASLQTPISAFRLYKGGDKPVGPGRTLVQEVAPNSTTARDEGGVVLPPNPVGYYQVIGVSCLGNLEGPY